MWFDCAEWKYTYITYSDVTLCDSTTTKKYSFYHFARRIRIAWNNYFSEQQTNVQ